jgi:hypothetical protein
MLCKHHIRDYICLVHCLLRRQNQGRTFVAVHRYVFVHIQFETSNIYIFTLLFRCPFSAKLSVERHAVPDMVQLAPLNPSQQESFGRAQYVRLV